MKRILPMPTIQNPYAQIDYIFNLIADTKHTRSTKGNYKSALNFYKRFLTKTSNYNADLKRNKLLYLNKHLNEYTLVNLKRYIDENNIKGSLGYLTSHTINGHFSAIRIVFNEAVTLGLIPVKTLIEVSITGVERETETNTSYSVKEMKQIDRALKEELNFVYKVYRKEGYRKTGVGQDPRIEKGLWFIEDNLRWYFENVLDCKPILGTSANKEKHKPFIEYGPKKLRDGSRVIRGIYRKWGVSALVDSNLIMPLIVKFAMLTGLNVQSIYDLKIDCFEEKNKISGVPVLKYFKARSLGDKELHFDLEEKKPALKEFRQEQIKAIKNLITVIISITSEIREHAPNEFKDLLFIVQSSSNRNLGEISSVNDNISGIWSRKFIVKYQLKNDNGNPLIFNLQRFRPTRATEMVRNGKDIIELQHEMGHESVLTTLNYLDKNNLYNDANVDTSFAIEKIFENHTWASTNKIKYGNDSTDVSETTIFKGILCDCKNPYNPPEDVKKLKMYNEGDICSRINMCLFCNNVMIFKRNLPLLWMYKRQIDRTIDMKNADLPNQQFYFRTLDIIEQLFDENKSEFPLEDLKEAKEIAENLDELVDPITYQGIFEDS